MNQFTDKNFYFLNYNFNFVLIIKLVFLLLGLFVVGCTQKQVQSSAPRPMQTQQSWPRQGWPQDYDRLLSAEIERYPDLLALSPSCLASLSQNWRQKDKKQRTQFYVRLFRAMAFYESQHDRSTMALEKAFKNRDAISGYPVVSEGLLQLSYQDEQAYPECRFDFAEDAQAFREDFSLQDKTLLGENRLLKSWRAKNIQRKILSPEAQFHCAVAIAAKLVRHYPDRPIAEVLAKYWSVLNPKRGVYQKIRAQLD